MVGYSACLFTCGNREQEQKVKAQLCQTCNLVEKDQSANIAAIKVSQHLSHWYQGTSWKRQLCFCLSAVTVTVLWTACCDWALIRCCFVNTLGVGHRRQHWGCGDWQLWGSCSVTEKCSSPKFDQSQNKEVSGKTVVSEHFRVKPVNCL